MTHLHFIGWELGFFTWLVYSVVFVYICGYVYWWYNLFWLYLSCRANARQVLPSQKSCPNARRVLPSQRRRPNARWVLPSQRRCPDTRRVWQPVETPRCRTSTPRGGATYMARLGSHLIPPLASTTTRTTISGGGAGPRLWAKVWDEAEGDGDLESSEAEGCLANKAQ
jgi:hypothetical protein